MADIKVVLDAIRDRWAKTSPGPWNVCRDGECPCRQVWTIPGDAPVFAARVHKNEHQMFAIGLAHHFWGDAKDMIYGEIPEEQSRANGIAIAAAPEDVRVLLGHIEALERPRPEVRAFALLMEAELAKHDDRDGWQDCSIEWLLKRLQEEVEELAAAPELQPRIMGEEAADVANFAMMIADVSGALAAKEKP